MAAITPTITPTPTTRSASRTVRVTIRPGSAPNASRTPISRVRSVTVCEITPLIPTAASTSATPANAPSSAIANRDPSTDASTRSAMGPTLLTTTAGSRDRTRERIVSTTADCDPVTLSTRFISAARKSYGTWA